MDISKTNMSESNHFSILSYILSFVLRKCSRVSLGIYLLENSTNQNVSVIVNVALTNYR